MWPLFDLEQEYAKHPHIEREEVQKLHQWLRAQPHMPELWEHEVLIFYHACQYQMEYSKQVIEDYYTFRTQTEEFFDNLDINSAQMVQAQKTVAVCPLPNTTPQGHCVLIGKLLDTDSANFNLAGALKLLFAHQEILIQGTQLYAGCVVILDVSGLTFGHIARLSLMQVKKIIYFLQETGPIRLSAKHFVNPSPIVEKLLSLINLFIKKELKDHLVVHSTMDSLYKHIPRPILPRDYGGDDLSIAELATNVYEKIRKYRLDVIEYNNNRRVNEKLRPKARNNTFVRMWQNVWQTK
ncbi:alpha-tocopherol transfer protein-like [Stomoxys calcitrans]|uniref:alpha-tocopherol transfer protein-like n=1 Tax=Stomoxys calcitrans TaxID=35570 RepID=UPI0027E24073|nr:alpha-tocopherol transfer protein-like [Stomoxys calcitrans]